MKKILLLAVGLAGAASAATAADLPYKAPLTPFVPAAANWTGCYIGGHIGGGASWTRFRTTSNAGPFGDFTVGDGFDNPASGFIGGGQAGCNYQMGRYVFGIEGTYTAADIKGSYDTTAFNPASPDFFTHRITDIATVVGRFGLAFDQWHFYTKLGWAGARNTASVSDPVTPGGGSDAHWHNGATIGSGTEYAITRNWIAGIETNYYRFESKSYELGGAPGLDTFSVRPRDVWSVVGRLNYKF